MWSKSEARTSHVAAVLAMVGLFSLFSACTKVQTIDQRRPVVEVVEVTQRDVPVYSEWTASTDGLVNATIRAQVQGYLVKQDYTEGDYVKKGQVLFQIDPRPFQAAVQQVKGQLAQQQARYENAKANLDRIRPLVWQHAISAKDLDDAVGNEQAYRAMVDSAQAALDKADLDLSFTRITSPINGIAGIARAQIGNLVGPGSIEDLTTVSTVDPIKIYVPLSEQEYLKNMHDGQGKVPKESLQLILADGSTFPQKGRFAFADRDVDVRTGTIKVAALFPNPGNVLRPGQFARVRALTTTRKGALLVPQRSITEIQGKHQLAVVGPDNKIEVRPVNVGPRVDNMWVVEDGLKASEKVVAEGVQKVKPGMTVTTRPFIAHVPNGAQNGSTHAGQTTTGTPDQSKGLAAQGKR
jgi:membrane fusion protein, multidrug efflux system